MPATVYVYRNLGRVRKNPWVIADKPKAAAVWPDAECVTLRGVTFKENLKAWARCLRQVRDPNCKHGWDVHAYAVGELIPETAIRKNVQGIAVTYDKYGCGRFIRKDTRQPITWCEFVMFAPDGSTVAIGEVK